MKKVLFCATVDSHILHFHLPYLKMFKEKGYEVHVATNGKETIPYCDVKHIIPFERSPIKYNNIKAIQQLKKVINQEKFDIIHCHTPMGGVVTRLAAKKVRKTVGTKVIYTAHGFHFYKGAPVINWLIYYPIEKFLSKYTDILITINDEDYNIAKRNFKAKDVELVNGVGVETKKFNFIVSEDDKIKLRKQFELSKDDFVIIYAAELSKRKNQGMIINAMEQIVKKYNNVKLILPGIDSMNGMYQKMVKEKKLKKNIKFLGYRTDIPMLMKISDMAVSTSKQEGLPVNIIEAMICGLPIVATDCRGNRDVIKGNGYIIELDDIGTLEDYIEKIYTNSVNKIVPNIKKYRLDEVMEKMKKIYNENEKILIIPTCTDLNRGDQALVLETKRVIENKYSNVDIYMMSTGETIQCEKLGLKKFEDILKHPGRLFKKNKSNIRYGKTLKIKWGVVAVLDFINSILLLNKFMRKIIIKFVSKETKKSINLFNDSVACYVKGGGFMHDYNGGIIGWYTMWFQTYHIRLALAMNKKVYIMPNSFGPFKSKKTSKMLNKILDKCDFVSARESISSNRKTNGLERNIELYPDLAFYLDKTDKITIRKYLLHNYNIDSNRKKYVAITVRPYRFYSYEKPNEKYEEYKKAFAKFIEFLKQNHYIPVLVAHTRAENQHENDEHCIKEILDILKDKNDVIVIKDDNLNCYDLKAIYGECAYVIGTRFHSVIFSLEQLIPCIAITYGGNKGDGIMKDIGLSEYAIKIGELNYENLKEKFIKLLENEKEVKNNIEKYLVDVQNKYRKLLDNIKI